MTSLSLYQQLAASISEWIIRDSILHNKKQIHIKQTRQVTRRDDKPATGDKHQEVFPLSKGGNDQERPGYYNSSSNIVQAQLCSLRPATFTLRQRESARPWLHQHATNTAPASLKRLKNQIRVYGSTSAKCHAYSNTLACSSTHGRTTSLYISKSTPSNWLNTCRFFPTCKSIEHWLDLNILSCFPHFSLNGMPAYQDFSMFKKNQISWWKSHLSMFLNELKFLGENFTQTKSERKRAAYNQGGVCFQHVVWACRYLHFFTGGLFSFHKPNLVAC